MGRFASGKLASNADAERLERVLNAKQRLIGVDTQALNEQVAALAARKAAEKQQDEAFSQVAQQYDTIVCLQHEEVNALKQTQNREVAAYRQAYQGKQTTREWDLNRPDATRLPGPTDGAQGAASMRRFDGEDLSCGGRTAAQMAQCSNWWADQTAAKAAAKQAEAEAHEATAQLVRAQDAVQRDVMAAEAATKAALNRRTAEENRALAAARAAAAAAEKEAEAAQKLKELDITLSSPWLCEDPREAASALSPARVRKDHFKGMDDAQRRAILQQQLAQVEAKRALKRAALQEEADFARMQKNIQLQLQEQASRADAFRRAQAEAAATVLRAQMEEKKKRTAALDEAYANKVTDRYWAQFGTSHR